MQCCCSFRQAIRSSRTCFFTALLFCLSLLGCNNDCFVFVSNPGGSISTSTPSCQFKTATGTVRLRVTASPAASTEPGPTSIQHIFVTLRGIEAQPSAIAGDESPDWRELAPKLATQPEQLDLLAHSVDSCARSTFDDVAVPADAYREIRLRLSANQPATNEAAPEENACGNVSFNCVVTSDGAIRPLALDALTSQFQIPSEHISGGFFRVLPDTPVNLDIEFKPQSSLLLPADEAVRLVPAFTVVPQAPCESAAAPNQSPIPRP
jgi:Domain of unknown function (DUF4382)